MNLIPLFSRLESIERETGRLYQQIAKLSGDRFPRLVALFSHLAEEEEEHERMVALARNLIIETERASMRIDTLETEKTDPGFMILEDKSRDLDAHLGFVLEKQALFAADLPDMNESQIVAMALDIEVQLQESHTLKEIDIRDKQLAGLLGNLARADAAHRALLEEWLHRNP